MTGSNPVDQGSIPWGHANFYLSKVLSGCIRGLGPCGLGSNPSRETKFLSVYNVSPVDGLVWNEEAAGSNPATQTKN